MENIIKKLKNADAKVLAFTAAIILCVIGLIAFFRFYFHAYTNPYVADKIIDLSEHWQYETDRTGMTDLANLRSGPYLQDGEIMRMYKTLDIKVKDANILIRTNHQSVKVYLDEILLYTDAKLNSDQNPGIALHFIELPEDYLHKTLVIELISPYANYAGRTSPILMGTIQSLEAYTFSCSMRSIILMAMCLLMGLCVIVFTLIQTLNGSVQPQNLALGVFAVIWALYYTCTEYIVLQFYTPVMVSVLSLGLYFIFPVPLIFFFYFSFKKHKNKMLPTVILHSVFSITSVLLQLFGIVDLPRLLNINNIFLVGLAYMVLLCVLEAFDRNPLMMVSAPFLIIAYISMLINFNVFYSRQGVVPYTYRDAYLMLILAVLISNIWQFFYRYYRGEHENEVLAQQNRMARESYEQIKTHILEVGVLKHEIKNHFTALQTYLASRRYDEACNYLDRYTAQSDILTKVVYHENFIINSVTGNYMRIAKERDIRIKVDLKASPNNVSEPDLYSLLSNILENALEACETVPERKDRFIKLTMTRREPYLIISCINSRSGKIMRTDNGFETTKQGGEHGYGLWTIARIAEIYGGFSDIDFDEHTFTITAAIKDEKTNITNITNMNVS